MMPHCWEDSWGDKIYGPEPRSSCLLPDGHDGPHEWTADSEIIIQFAEEAE